jgi:Ino eighty subunit 1
MSRSIAVKLKDGAPFTRQDLQYDILHAIFSDTQAVFTDPFTPVPTSGTPGKMTFRDLYIQAIMKSPKSSKMLKDKMKQTPRFATDFAMLCLLANTGRINTTMSCKSCISSWLAQSHVNQFSLVWRIGSLNKTTYGIQK